MMSDDMLSQEEIDALLKQTGDDEDQKEEIADKYENPPVENYLSFLEQDTLGEIGNISFGSSATTLATLLNQKVEITTPQTSLIRKSNLKDEFPQPHVSIQVEYTEGFSGMNLFVIKTTDAAIIADLMLGGDGTSPSEELSEIHLSAVQESMNQMMGTAATSMSTVFSKRVDISPPTINMLDVKEGEGTEQIPSDDIFAKVSFQLKIGELIDSSIMQIIPVEFSKDLVYSLLNPPQEEKEIASPVEGSPDDQASHQDSNPAKITNNQDIDGKRNEEEPLNSAKFLGEKTSASNSAVQPAAFSNFEGVELEQSEKRNLDMLLDIPLKVTVELGRTKRAIKEILELSSGSIIELDKLAGEPVDIHVNDKLIAQGEVVVIDENFGVRVTEILSQTERIKKIN